MHVFVETNWVVDVLAPGHHRETSAVALLDRAVAGELVLHLPSVCLIEARQVIPNRFKANTEAKAIRHFVRWARGRGTLPESDADVVLKVANQLEAQLKSELDDLDDRLTDLAAAEGLDVFAISEEMLRASLDVGLRGPILRPFDQAILAAVLTRADQLHAEGVELCFFCEIDRDLLPWDRHGNPKRALMNLYDAHRSGSTGTGT